MDLTLRCFADADWGSDPSDRKSTLGFCIYLGSNLVTWSSKKQAVVSRSTTEAEFRSIAFATTELSWIVSLLKELSLSPLAPTIYSDNLGAVLLTANPIFHSKTKHFALDVHYVRDHVRKQHLCVQHIPAQLQVADALTKPVSRDSFQNFRDKLRVHSLQPPP